MLLKQKFLSLLAFALLLGSFAIVASAQDQTPAEKPEKHRSEGFDRHRGFRKGMHGEFRGMRGLFGIELTEDQKTRIKQIHEANRPDTATMEEFKALREARRNGTLTEDQKAKAKALHEQMRAKHESVRQQILAILTPEQRQQLETRKAEMQKLRQERRRQWQQKTQSTPPTEKPNDN